jgi:hypothetical protein
MLALTLPGITIGRRVAKAAAIAYADDVTVFLSTPRYVQLLQDAIGLYERAAGAEVNKSKSIALPIGDWDTSVNIGNIPYRQDVRILGIRFTATVRHTVIST